MKPKEDATNWIVKNQDRLTEISDKIWTYAEVGLQEYKSSSLLAETLEKESFKLQRVVAGMPTAFVASWGKGKPVIGVLGEFDALPSLSQKPIPTKEPVVSGAPGHGCGHNIHGTSGVAGAIGIAKAMEANDINGTVKFFGCPAEETLVGKVFMVRDGIFKDVDVVLSHHPGPMNSAVLTSYNAMNSVKFHFYGKAAHAGGSPDQGRGASDAVELMNVGVNYMREHIIQEARVHYVIEDGGHEPNVIPAYARSWYYVRAPERPQVESIYNWILRIADGADLMAGTAHTVEFLTGCYNTLPNRRLCELIVKNMREIGTPTYASEELAFAQEMGKSISPEEKRASLRRSKRPDWQKLLDVTLDTSVADPWGEGESSGGSTDVGDVSWQTPTVEFQTTSCVLGAPGHSWQRTAASGMSIGHKSLIFAANTIAWTGLDLITKPSVLKAIREEFEERIACTIYVSPLPPDLKPPLHQLPTSSTQKK
ncbi:MAG: aminobenzoyl-glutamate utilization protein [Thermoproteota archaeon]|nr:aminobenzoyl-glutamate utilization protein [Thermoproteota archaeon]